MTQIQHGSAAYYDPEAHRKLFTDTDGLFDTLNIKEELSDQDREDVTKSEFKKLPKFPGQNAKHSLRVRIINDENNYKKWLIDLYRYLYYINADETLTADNIRDNNGFSSKQRDWIELIQESCIQISKLPEWLESEISDRYNPGDPLLVALAIMREKYHPKNLIQEIEGFRAHRRYKLENIHRILQNFEERIRVGKLRNLEPLLVGLVSSELRNKRDQNGKLHPLTGHNNGLLQIIGEINETIISNKSQSNRASNVTTRTTDKKVHKPQYKFGNKHNSQKGINKKHDNNTQSEKAEDTKSNQTVANLRH